MRHTQTLTTLLLAGTLLFPTGLLAGPKAKPLKTPPVSPYLTDAEHMCRARGTFVYNRALDRNGGATLTDALLAVRQWDAAHAVPQDIRDLHYVLLRVIYSTPWSTPEITRQAIELDCLEHAQATPAAQAAPRTPAAPAPQDIRY